MKLLLCSISSTNSSPGVVIYSFINCYNHSTNMPYVPIIFKICDGHAQAAKVHASYFYILKCWRFLWHRKNIVIAWGSTTLLCSAMIDRCIPKRVFKDNHYYLQRLNDKSKYIEWGTKIKYCLLSLFIYTLIIKLKMF